MRQYPFTSILPTCAFMTLELNWVPCNVSCVGHQHCNIRSWGGSNYTCKIGLATKLYTNTFCQFQLQSSVLYLPSLFVLLLNLPSLPDFRPFVVGLNVTAPLTYLPTFCRVIYASSKSHEHHFNQILMSSFSSFCVETFYCQTEQRSS